MPFCVNCPRTLASYASESGPLEYECPCDTSFLHFKEPNLVYSEERLSSLKIVVTPKRELTEAEFDRVHDRIKVLCNFSNYEVVRRITGDIVVVARRLPYKYSQRLLQLLREL